MADDLQAFIQLPGGGRVPLESEEGLSHIADVARSAITRRASAAEGGTAVPTTATEPTTAPEAEGSIFDATAYELPIPKKDGHRADILKIALGGAVELDLYDEDALAFIQGLRLGQELELTVTVRVASSAWQHSLRGEAQDDHAVFAVGLKAHTLDIPARS